MDYPRRINSIPNDSESEIIEILSIRPKDDHAVCLEFQKNQKRIFEKEFGLEQISSLDESWMKMNNVYVIYAINKKTKEILGGLRVHVANDIDSLPIELAIGLDEPKIYDLVESLSKKGCLELCALWMSRKGVINGLMAFDLIRGVISICHQLNIQNVLTLAGPNSTRITKHYSAKVYNNFGDNGVFYYPNDRVKCLVSNVLVSDVFDKVNATEKRILNHIFNNPLILIEKKGKKGDLYIEYKLML